MSNLTSIFDECRKQPDGETLLQLRTNYFIDAAMNGKDASNTSILIPQAGVVNSVKERKERERYAKDIAFALKLLDDRLSALEAQLARIENDLVGRYGKYFAATLAVDHLDDETYKHIMTIQNDEDRRQEFAKALNEGLENGTIEKDAFDDKPEFKEWLEVRKEEQYLIDAEQNAYNSEVDNLISSEQKVEGNHIILDKNEEDTFNSIFTNKNSVTI